MQSFDPKGVNETRNRTVVLEKQLRDAGVTYTGTPTVSASVYTGDDSDPSAILTGDPQINSDAAVFDGVTISAGQAITQAIHAGEADVVYILHFACQLSNGEVWNEDVLQRVTAYVPP